MGLFKNLFSKAKTASENESEKGSLDAPADCFGQAEQIANVVSNGLENESYSEMSKQLSEIVSLSEEKESYVFEYPDMKIHIFCSTVCAVLCIFFLYSAFIGISTAVFSAQYRILGIAEFIASLLLIVANSFYIAKTVSAAKYRHRFDTYAKVLKFNRIEILDDLARVSNQKESQIIKDLEKAVRQKLVPQGHFTRGNLAFIVSDENYGKYMENCASYDRYLKKQIEEKVRMKELSSETKKIIETGESYIQKIRDYNSIIKDKYVSEKLNRIETVASMIFNEVGSNPAQAHSLGLFLNYYLPTSEKLLEAYITIGEKPIAGQSLAKAQKDIEQSLETILKAYENILERLYSEHEADIASDIAAMEIMMEQEGLTE